MGLQAIDVWGVGCIVAELFEGRYVLARRDTRTVRARVVVMVVERETERERERERERVCLLFRWCVGLPC